MDWEQGRQLSSITINGGTVNYEYNEDGLRTVRQLANGARREYFYNGTQLEYIKIVNANGNLTSTMRYIYNSSGQAEYIMYVPAAYAKNSNVFSLYYILRDSEGKIHKLIKVRQPNSAGTGVTAVLKVAVIYTYGPYGELLKTTKASGESVGTYNPLVYKDYIWDSETDWYYAQSRYYDPVVGRFINADVFTNTPQSPLSTNMFIYCLNNPMCYRDITGMIPAKGGGDGFDNTRPVTVVIYDGRTSGYLGGLVGGKGFERQGKGISKALKSSYYVKECPYTSMDEFVETWNSLKGNYRSIYILSHGYKGGLSCSGKTLSNLPNANYTFDELNAVSSSTVYLLSCNAATDSAGGSAAANFAQLTNGAVYGIKNSSLNYLYGTNIPVPDSNVGQWTITYNALQ